MSTEDSNTAMGHVLTEETDLLDQPDPLTQQKDGQVIVHFNPQYIKDPANCKPWFIHTNSGCHAAHHVDFESCSKMATMEPATVVVAPCKCGVSKFSLVMEGVLEWDDPDTAAIRSIVSDDEDQDDGRVRCVNVDGMEAKLKKQRSQIAALRNKLNQGGAAMSEQKKLVAKMTKQLRENDDKTTSFKTRCDEATTELKECKEQLKIARKSKERAQEELSKFKGSSTSEGLHQQPCTVSSCAEASKQASKCKKLSTQNDSLGLKQDKLVAQNLEMRAQLELLKTQCTSTAQPVIAAPLTVSQTSGQVLKLTREGPFMELVITLTQTETIDFMPGQWCGLQLLRSSLAEPSTVSQGVLSFLSTPDELPLLRFSLTDSAGNPASFRNYVFHSARVGDSVQVSAGRGSAGLATSMLPVGRADMLFLGAGSAISALLSVLKQSLQSSAGVMTLIHSVASSAAIAMDSSVEALRKQHGARLQLLRTTTQPTEETTGLVGRVNATMLAPYVSRCSLFFVSGGMSFVTAMVQILLELGVWAPRIRSDCSPPLTLPTPPREMRRQIRRTRESTDTSANEVTDPGAVAKARASVAYTIKHKAKKTVSLAVLETRGEMRVPPGMLIQFGGAGPHLGLSVSSSKTLRGKTKRQIMNA